MVVDLFAKLSWKDANECQENQTWTLYIYIHIQDPTWHWHSKQLPGWSANSFFLPIVDAHRVKSMVCNFHYF